MGESDLVELNTGPVGRSVDPKVLGESAIRTLGTGQVDQCAAGGVRASAGEQRGGGLHHVARPDQVITAEVVVALGRSPGNRSGGDECTGVGLVLVGQDDIVADAHQAAAVGRCLGQRLGRVGAEPLLDEALRVQPVGRRKRLHHACERGVVAVAKCNGDGELAIAGDVNLTHDGDVAIDCLAELPVHRHVGREILEAVAGANKAAGGTGEAAVDAQSKRGSTLPAENCTLPGNFDRPRGVLCSAPI